MPKTNIKTSIFSSLAFGALFGLFWATTIYDIQSALIIGLISGGLFGLFIYFFIASKNVNEQTQIENLDHSPIIFSGGANHFLKDEAVGGKLYLLVNRLQFQSHNFNIQNHGLTIDIEQIKEVRFCNTLGLIPNGLVISTLNGQTEKFVVNNRKHWKTEIEKLI